MAPMGILIGIATATIGFTAWGIVVPLVWIGLGGGKDDGWMYYALFTSIFMDFVNGLCLTVIYAIQEKIDWKKGALIGVPACGIAVGCIFASKVALEYFKEDIKKGLGYLVIVIGLTFIIRGVSQWRKAKELAKATEIQILLPPSQINTLDMPNHKVEDGPNETIIDYKEDLPGTISESEDSERHLETHGNEIGCISVVSGPIVPNGSGSIPAVISSRTMEHQKKEEIEEKWTVAWIIRYTLMILITVGSSVLSGLLGMGSGTNFVLAFLYLMKFDLITATGTGVLIMTGLMCSMAVCYLLGAMPAVHENIFWLWPYFVLPSGFGLIGTIMGAFFSLKFSPLKMNFVIAFLLVAVGLIAVVEPYIIKAVDG